VSQEIRQQIADRIERYQAVLVALDAVDALDAPRKAKAVKVSARKKREPIAAGSLADRIISMLREAGEPTKKALIVKHAGALEYDVALTLKELVADARIVKTGTTASTRYQLP